MKSLIVSLMLLGAQAMADSASTVNASIYRIDLNLRLYEVCGTVTGGTTGTVVDIEVDPGKYSGHYVTHTNGDGKFCQIVRVVGNSINITTNNMTLAMTATNGASASISRK